MTACTCASRSMIADERKALPNMSDLFCVAPLGADGSGRATKIPAIQVSKAIGDKLLSCTHRAAAQRDIILKSMAEASGISPDSECSQTVGVDDSAAVPFKDYVVSAEIGAQYFADRPETPTSPAPQAAAPSSPSSTTASAPPSTPPSPSSSPAPAASASEFSLHPQNDLFSSDRSPVKGTIFNFTYETMHGVTVAVELKNGVYHLRFHKTPR